MTIAFESDAAERRLRASLKIREVVERSFRSMIRESVFLRSSRSHFAQEAAERAAHYLECNLVRSGVVAHRKRAVAGLTATIERFAISRLCDRLRRVPIRNVFASESPEYDLLVIGDDGKRYGVRFVASARAGPFFPKTVSSVPAPEAIHELLTYSLISGRVKREVRKSALLCA